MIAVINILRILNRTVKVIYLQTLDINEIKLLQIASKALHGLK